MPIILAVLVVIADQVIKYVCASALPALPGASLHIWDGVFHLTYLQNRGAAFGMFSSVPWIPHAISILCVILMVAVLIAKYKEMPKLMRYSICLILAGAVGNLIDRLLLGYVRDMFDFRLINFYVFNLADAAITIGAIALALDILFFKGRDFLKREFADDKKKKADVKTANVEALEDDKALQDETPDDKTPDRDKNKNKMSNIEE